MNKKKNSYFLLIYMMLAFSYYIAGTTARAILLAVIIFLSFYVFQKNTSGNKHLRKKIIPFVILFIVAFVIQLLNETLTPFLLYALAAPAMAFFISTNTFDTKIIKKNIYMVFVIFSMYFILNRSLNGIFYQMSANYVSIVMIMNVVLINALERIQRERISITPALLAFCCSLLAMGRSGILCSLILLIIALLANWRFLSLKKKLLLGIFVMAPIILFIVLKSDLIVNYIAHLSVLEKFEERGIDSPARNILKNEYLENMNIKNIMLGFNYTDNEWFIHYGQNPHNSFIRLHHYYGFLFFIIVAFIIKSIIKLFFLDKFLFCMILIILLRSWTDISMFQTVYDFIFVFIFFIPYFHTKNDFIPNENRLRNT